MRKRQTLLASNMNIIASHPLVYLPHSALYYIYPPKSHTFILTPPFFTDLTFKPIVGIVGSGSPIDNLFNNVVLPLFSKPTNATSIYGPENNYFSLSNIAPILIKQNQNLWILLNVCKNILYVLKMFLPELIIYIIY